VLHDPNLGYALALGMIVITGLSQRPLYLDAHPQRAVAANEGLAPRLLAGDACSARSISSCR
jgi:hypothetical protein